MFCKNCGARLDDGSVFCGECGAKQPTEAASAPQTPVQPYSAPVQPYEAPVQQTPVQPYNAPYQQPVQPYGQQYPGFQPPKKSKGPLVAVLIIAAVVVIALVVVLFIVLTKNNAKTSPFVETTPSVTQSGDVQETEDPLSGGNETVSTDDPLASDGGSESDYDLSDEFMGIWQYGGDTYVQINYTYIIVMQPSANKYEIYDNELTNEYLSSAAFGGKCSYTFSDDKYSVSIHPDEAGESDVNLTWIANLYNESTPEIGVWENQDLAGEVLFLCETGYAALMNSESAVEGTYSTYGTSQIDFYDTAAMTTYPFTNVTFEDEDDTMYLTLDGVNYTFNRLY